MEHVLSVFNANTQDTGGKLDIEHFKDLLQTFGLPDGDAQELFEIADVNQDGEVDCREFIKWVFGDVGGIEISGHPQDGVNKGAFVPSTTDPEANGQPHYENGMFHLYLSHGSWRIARSFEPTKTGCWSFICPADSGTVPEGENEWDAFVDGEWTKVMISVSRLSSSALATIATEKAAALEEQAKKGLRFQGHPQEQVNWPAFTRSEKRPLANGVPHYENGWHLYFSSGKWRVASQFEPSGTACWSYVDPSPSGCVPEGENEWSCYVDGSWTDVKITVSPVETASTAEIDCKDVIEPFRSSSSDGKPILSEDAYDEVCKHCEDQGAKFIDADFPSVPSSITQPGDKAQYSADGWKRLSELSEYPFVYDEVAGNDIEQGLVGNCYMCTVLNAMAVTHFEMIKAVFSNRPDANECGCYSLRLCHPGTKEWVYVLVDDYVPVRRGSPCFLKSKNRNEMWCSLLEKAIAKLAGSYARIDARATPMPPVLSSYGTAEIMEMLTGSVGLTACVWTAKTSDSEIWERLQEVIVNRWPVTTSCAATVEGQVEEGKDDDAGLVRHHSYSLVGAVQMPCGDKLVRVRNPWGSFEWKGKWGDDDTENWTEENRAFVDGVPEGGGPLGHRRDDGMFFMPLQDYLESFQFFQYCPIVGDSVWERLMKEKAQALREQSRGELAFSGHPQDTVNSGSFVLSKERPRVNERPHYENDSGDWPWHLYFSCGKWRITSKVEPTKTSCWSFTDATSSGTVPEGEHAWDAYVDGEWKSVKISVTHT
eukprot:TRINITY_DN32045_c0_g1_i1.p1 TRINITY_DN32045_c0_g1~~TRINITY_DN32045_c0_g1_i1.p1  ORF type:complete len:782 (-),score=96.50 TRINITY_DN32045_c0_g1_i1:6-2303(-)